LSPPSFRLTEKDIQNAIDQVPAQDLEDIQFAQAQVRNFAQKQKACLNDLEIETKDGLLTIAGRKGGDDEAETREFLHRGIAERGFLRRFQLADHVLVTGAQLRNGMLRVELERELPEAKKPRWSVIRNVFGWDI